MTAVVWEEDDEEVGFNEKEMRDEASVTTGWAEFLTIKVSTRLSDKGENN